MTQQQARIPLTGEPKRIVEEIVHAIRKKLELGEELPASIFIGSFSKELEIIPIDTSSNVAKEMSTQVARVIAKEMSADCIIVATEAWMVQAKKTDSNSYKDLQENMRRQYKSLSEHPARMDVMHISVETREGMWCGTAEIKFKYPSKKKRTFGAVAFEMIHQEGRFVGILPPPVTTTVH